MDETGTASFKGFADSQGWSPSYVTQLKQAGRLVLTPDGKRVRVSESLRLIADTRNPDKANVAARHATLRPAAPAADEADSEAPDDPPSDQGVRPDDPLSRRRALAQAETEEARARKALRDEAIELGQLLPVEDVRAAVADAVTTLRSELDNIPATLAPSLAAEPDESRVRVMLRDAIEGAQRNLVRKLEAVGRRA